MNKKMIKVLLKLNRLKIFPMSDKKYLEYAYYYHMDKKLDLKNPITFTEKLQWIKLYDRKDIYTMMADKYEVKKYVSEKIGKEYVIPTIGIYNSFDEINFDKLPKQFVIKCTHDSGGLVIVKDKNKLNIKQARKKINKSLKTNYYDGLKEWPYKNIKPRIIIEKYYETSNGNLDDYKFQTFNGKVAYSYVCTERSTGKVKFTFFDKNKKFIPVTQGESENDIKNAKLPENYDKFIYLAEKLAEGISEVRVDFYYVDNKILFGELTFFDAAGFEKFHPEKYDKIFGDMFKLPIKK